jgi:hypothetical protein
VLTDDEIEDLADTGTAARWDDACDDCFAASDAPSQGQALSGEIHNPVAVMDITAVAAGLGFAFNGFGVNRDKPRFRQRWLS